MIGANRFDGLDCPVESGEACVMPDRRSWGFDHSINIPSIVTVLGLIGGLMGYALTNNTRVTKTEGDVEVIKATDKGIVDHAQFVEQANIRDRAEMRDDIKEIKRLLQEGRRR